MSNPDGPPQAAATIEVSEVDEALSPAPRLLPLRKLASSSLANAVLLAFQSLVFLVFTRLALRTLGAELYGLWTVLFALQTVSVIATIGVPQAATKFAAQFGTVDSDHGRLSEMIAASYTILLCAGAFATVAVFLARGLIANMLVPARSSAEMGTALGLVAATFIPTFIHQGSRALLLARFRNVLVGSLDLLQSLILAAGVIGLARKGTTARELAIWILVVSVATALASLACVYGDFRRVVRFHLTRDALGATFRYGFFAWIAVLGSMLFDGGDRLLVSHLLGPAVAGAYGIATGVAMRLTQLNTPATLLLSPFVSSHEAGNRLDAVARALRLTNRAVACLLATAGSLLLLWANELLTIWISPAFARDYSVPFSILVLVYATFSMAGPGYQTLLGLGEVRLLAVLGVIGSITTLAIMFALAPAFGLVGAALANAAYLVVLVASFRALRATGLRAGRSFMQDDGLPLLLLYIAACISLLQSGTVIRAWYSTMLIVALTIHAFRGISAQSGRGSVTRTTKT